MIKKLYRSRRDAKICGICGGIGAYLNMDPTLIRLIALVVIFLMQIIPGLVVYFIAAMIIPREPEYPSHHDDDYSNYN
ncbi:MAG: PspC domain-containing protein [Defluviitaleaceae bacterium]|nr:PspC domain-containing protein [Defluviitaleaceae bacterium]